MVRIHVLDRPLLGLNQRSRVTYIGEELFRLQIEDSAEARDQMSARGPDPDEGEIAKIHIASADGWTFR